MFSIQNKEIPNKTVSSLYHRDALHFGNMTMPMHSYYLILCLTKCNYLHTLFHPIFLESSHFLNYYKLLSIVQGLVKTSHYCLL